MSSFIPSGTFHPDRYGTCQAQERRTDTVRLGAAKRKGNVGRLEYQALTVPGADEGHAQRHEKTLEAFYAGLVATDTLRGNVRGGANFLFRQMAGAIGQEYAAHEIIWRPGKAKATSAEFRLCPLWWFETTTGKLRYLESEI